MPDEPPATEAGGRSVSPIWRSIGLDVAAERVGGDLGERGPRAGTDVDRADLTAKRPRDVLDARRCCRASRIAGYTAEATPVPTSQSPSRRAPGRRVARSAQPNRSAPVWRHSTSRRSDHGWPVSGSTSGSLRMRSSIGSTSRRRRVRPSPTSRANIPGQSPGARIQNGTGTSSFASRCEVLRLAAAYSIRDGDGGLFGELLDASRSARRPRG